MEAEKGTFPVRREIPMRNEIPTRNSEAIIRKSKAFILINTHQDRLCMRC